MHISDASLSTRDSRVGGERKTEVRYSDTEEGEEWPKHKAIKAQ